MSRTLWLVRHGETEWSRSGSHTGRTDIPLTEAGREQAAAVGRWFAGRPLALVLSSPLSRAHDTCNLAGYGDQAELDHDLLEWDYGDYEGRTTPDIRKEQPGWSLWVAGVPHGESIAQVSNRADRVIARILREEGDMAVFAHGHILRILAARWTEFEPQAGRRLALGTASVSSLGYERDTRVITQWNMPVASSPW